MSFMYLSYYDLGTYSPVLSSTSIGRVVEHDREAKCSTGMVSPIRDATLDALTFAWNTV
jgi:hypothetical protein